MVNPNIILLYLGLSRLENEPDVRDRTAPVGFRV